MHERIAFIHSFEESAAKRPFLQWHPNDPIPPDDHHM